MARDKLTEYSATASENTVCGDVNIAENSALPSDLNNYAREIMTHLKNFSDGTDAIDALAVDNLKLDGNTISSTDTNGDITISPDGTGDIIIGSIGKIATTSNDLNIHSTTSSHSGLRLALNAVLPTNASGNVVDNQVDLGKASANYRFKDLYLSGGAYIGGTAAGNRLDQYEESTFTPSFSFTGGNGTLTTAAAVGTYLRVGAFAFINGFISIGAKGTASGDCRISGIPFTPRNTGSLFQLINVGLNSTKSGQDFDGDFYYFGQVQANDATLRLYSHKGAGGVDQLNAVDVQNGTDFRFSGWFAI